MTHWELVEFYSQRVTLLGRDSLATDGKSDQSKLRPICNFTITPFDEILFEINSFFCFQNSIGLLFIIIFMLKLIISIAICKFSFS